MNILLKLNRCQVRRISKTFHKTGSKIVAMRCQILLCLGKKHSVSEIRDKLGCTRATVYRTIYRFEDTGENCLYDQRHLKEPIKVDTPLINLLYSYVDMSPMDYGWSRTTWTLELFSKQLFNDSAVQLSPRYIKTIL